MKESEKAENNVNVREIIANVLNELGMNAPSFATATGIAYQRIFDLQRGRTKKFNPGVVNMICEAFPTINKNYLYTGEGPILNSDVPAELDANIGHVGIKPEEIADILKKQLDLAQQIADKDKAVDAEIKMLIEKEHELMQRELEIAKREMELGINDNQE